MYQEKIRFKPYIFIETNFKIANNTLPKFALAFLENRRYIVVDPQRNKQPIEKQIDDIKKIIVQHYNTKHDSSEIGSIFPRGKIHSYKYGYDVDKVIEFSPSGDIIGESDQLETSVAYVALK